jgi:1,4-dihydroxy-2-naphthoate octaprenyltransferase
MENEEKQEITTVEIADNKREVAANSGKKGFSTHIVTADSVLAEEVPTVPIGPLEVITALEPEVSVHSVAAMRAVNSPSPLVVQPSEYRRSSSEWLQIWRDGLRTYYLPLSLMPVLLGSVLAWTQTFSPQTPLGRFHLTHFLASLAVVILIQSGAHLLNDYYDYQRGIDSSNTLGPGGLIQQGFAAPTRILIIGLGLLGIGALIGLITAINGGPLVFLFGLLIVLCAYFYSAPPRPLSSLGLSEFVAFLVFGPLITLSTYLVQSGGSLNARVFFYSLPMGLLAAAVIWVNNIRDIEGDSHASKITLPSLLGLQRSRAGFLILLLLPYLIVLFLGFPHGSPHLILITFWTIPLLAMTILGAMRTNVLIGFNQVLRQTLGILTSFTLLLVVALIISSVLPVLVHIPARLLPF